MSADEKQRYYSTRIRIGDVKSPKELVGFKEFTVEVTIGNQDAIVIRNKDDVAQVLKEKNIFDLVEDVYEKRKLWRDTKHPEMKFIDELPKEDKP